jgi:hypothetical protein
MPYGIAGLRHTAYGLRRSANSDITHLRKLAVIAGSLCIHLSAAFGRPSPGTFDRIVLHDLTGLFSCICQQPLDFSTISIRSQCKDFIEHFPVKHSAFHLGIVIRDYHRSFTEKIDVLWVEVGKHLARIPYHDV